MGNPTGYKTVSVLITEELKNKAVPKEILGQMGNIYVSLLSYLEPNNKNRAFIESLEREYPEGSEFIDQIIGRYVLNGSN